MYRSHIKKTTGHNANSWVEIFTGPVLVLSPSTNKRCLTTKTFRCHQKNTANSYTVFTQRYIYAAFQHISQKESFRRNLKSLTSVKEVLSHLCCIHLWQCHPVPRKHMWEVWGCIPIYCRSFLASFVKRRAAWF